MKDAQKEHREEKCAVIAANDNRCIQRSKDDQRKSRLVEGENGSLLYVSWALANSAVPQPPLRSNDDGLILKSLNFW